MTTTTDRDDRIRHAIFERAEAAPLPLSLDALATVRPGRPPRSRRALLMAVIVVVMALVGAGVAIRGRDHRTSVVTSWPASEAPGSLAGQHLPATFGLPVGVGSGAKLVDEIYRGSGMAATAVYPTGPLGPTYAQAITTSGTDEAPTPYNGDLAVVNVLPAEQGDVVQGATGQQAGEVVSVGDHDAVLVPAWSPLDDNVVTWQQDGTAIVVASTRDFPIPSLEAFAGRVGELASTPVLPPGQVDRATSTSPISRGADGSWSLDGPVVPSVDDPTSSLGPAPSAWTVLAANAALAPTFSMAADRLTLADGQHVTVRIEGDPAHSGFISPMSGGYGGSSYPWPATMGDLIALYEVPQDDAQQHQIPPDLLVGPTPTDVTSVRFTTTDGQTLVAPTYAVGRGWQMRILDVPVPGLHAGNGKPTLGITHLVGLDASGRVVNSGPTAIGIADAGEEVVGRCGTPDPPTNKDC